MLIERKPPLRRCPVRGDLSARPVLDHRLKPGMIQVMMCEEHELDLLDRNAVVLELALERVNCLVIRRAAIDQGQRLTL